MFQTLPMVLRRSARWLFLPAVAVVVWGELKPSTPGPEGWEKVLHFTAYFGLAGIATVALANRRLAMWTALALAVFGGILEIVQSFVGRDAEWSDELANVVGVCFGLAAGLAVLRIVERAANGLRMRRGR